MTTPPPVPSATEALYRAALGHGDVAHYLPLFAAFDERGVAGARWSPAAGLLHLNWLLYRRLWRAAAWYALAVLGAAALIVWAARSGWLSAPGVQAGLWLALATTAIAVPGFRGLAWLHDDVRRRMTAAVRRARTVQEACDALQRAPRHRWVLWVAAALQIAAVVLIGLSVRAPVAATAALPAPARAEPPAPGPAPAPAPASRPEPEPEPPRASAPIEEPLPVASPPVAEPPPPTPITEASPRPRLRGHGVNVGLFGDAANAERVGRRLRDAGLPVVMDAVESARGPLTRVRVGPFDDAAAARQAAEQVRALGLEARVFAP